MLSIQFYIHLYSNSLCYNLVSGHPIAHRQIFSETQMICWWLLKPALNLSAAFHTVDHHNLLHGLKHDISIAYTALHWFESYLTGRTEFVALGWETLDPSSTLLIVVSPRTLFLVQPSFHCFADGTQLYLKVTHSSSTSSCVSWGARPCLCHLQVGLLYHTPHWDPWKEPSKSPMRSKLHFFDEGVKFNYLHPSCPVLAPCPVLNWVQNPPLGVAPTYLTELIAQHTLVRTWTGYLVLLLSLWNALPGHLRAA